MATNEGSGKGAAMFKGALMVLGAFTALVLVLSLAKPLLVLAALGGVGYLGYKMLAGNQKAVEGRERPALKADDDFERRMRELDALDRKLDAEIRKHS